MRINSIFVIVLTIFCSCTNTNIDEFINPCSEEDIYDINIVDCLALESGVEAVMEELMMLKYYSQSATRTDDCMANCYDLVQEICGVMNPYAYTFIDKCGFSVDDINEMFDVNYMELAEAESEVVSFSLFMYALGSNLDLETRSGSLTDCFLEATGIAAGMAAVGAMGAATLGKEATKKLVKAVLKKVGTRVLGGIGLALTAGEMIYCMAAE